MPLPLANSTNWDWAEKLGLCLFGFKGSPWTLGWGGCCAYGPGGFFP